MDYNLFVAERIAKLRQAKGVSARDMSLSIGQNVNYINHIENRKTEPSLSGLIYICEYFGVTPQDFFDEETENPALLNEVIRRLKPLNDKALEGILQFVSEISGKQKK